MNNSLPSRPAKSKKTSFTMRITLFLITTLFTLSIQAQETWELKKSENSIEVYVRDIPGTDFKEFKGVAEIKAEPKKVLDLLTDFPQTPKWGYNLNRIQILKKFNPNEFMIYYEVGMPWPLSDRDMVNFVKISRNSNGGGTLTLEASSDYKEESPDFVRIKEAKGSYEVSEASAGVSRVVYRYYANPEGIPAWVVNAFITDSPFSTLTKLRKILE